MVEYEESGYETHAPLGIRLAQALYHGTDHRSQVCTALTALGIEPPAIETWDLAREDGRMFTIESTEPRRTVSPRRADPGASADEAEGRERDPGQEEEHRHHGGQDPDVAQVALDVVVLGAFGGGQRRPGRREASGADALGRVERDGFARVRGADRWHGRRGGGGRRRCGTGGSTLGGRTLSGLAVRCLSCSAGHRYLGFHA